MTVGGEEVGTSLSGWWMSRAVGLGVGGGRVRWGWLGRRWTSDDRSSRRRGRNRIGCRQRGLGTGERGDVVVGLPRSDRDVDWVGRCWPLRGVRGEGGVGRPLK